MNTLGKSPLQGNKSSPNSILPAVVRNQAKEIPLEKALIISFFAHPLVVAFLWLLFKALILLLAFLGITLPLFEKPQPKVRDIEFVLVNKPEQKPLDKHTRFRADRNSRAGGKHDPTKPVTEPEPTSARSAAHDSGAPQRPSIKKILKAMHQRAMQNNSAPTQEKAPPRPVPQHDFPRPKLNTPKSFSMPAPTPRVPKTASPQGGPVTSGPIGYSSPGGSPAPVMSNSGSSGSSSGRSRYKSGYSAGGGSAGNPSPGNPSGRPGIDAMKEPDFGPYMRELQRRIKRNWEPPRGNESKRVVIYFKVSRDGRLLTLNVKKSSGVAVADKAAVSAVELTAPFSPLPAEYRGNDIDIEFTFDYNVFSVGGRTY